MTRTEKTYYLVFGLYNVSWSFVAAMYALFLLDRGLDLLQINLVLATFFVGSFLFEVPTGAVADLYGRKVSFLLSCAVRTSAFALYYVSESLPAFVCAELLDAVGHTLASGAIDAWAVDGMHAEGDRRSADRFFARSRMLMHAALIVGGCSGAYLAQGNLARPWLAGAGGFAATFAVALVCMRRDDPRALGEAGGGVGSSPGWRQALAMSGASLRSQIGDGLRTVARHPLLRWICLLTFVTAFAQMPFVQYWQPHLLARSGGATWVMGWAWALLSLAAFLGSALAQRAAGRVRRPRVLAVCSAVRAGAVLLAAWSGRFSPALAGIVLQSAAMGVGEPVVGAWVNENALPAQRATLLSVYAMSFTAGGSLGLITLGVVARAYGIPLVWTVSAAVFLLCAAGFLALRERRSAVADGAAALAVDQAGLG